MATRREGILAQIEAGVLDENVSLASLLQKCIVLGGQANSEELRAWARRELAGYSADETPEYRRVTAGLYAQITNRAGYNPITQRITGSELPRQIQAFLSEANIDVGVAVLGNGIGELEAWARENKERHELSPSWGDIMIDTLNRFNATPNSVVAAVYWPVAGSSIRGVLVRVRTALAELIAEMVAHTPPAQEVPDKATADQAVHFVITGDRPTVHVTAQNASSGTNTATNASPDHSVTVHGNAGTAIGSQTVSGSHNTVSGRDLQAGTPTSTAVAKWKQWGRIGGIVVGVAGIVAAIFAVLQYLGN